MGSGWYVAFDHQIQQPFCGRPIDGGETMSEFQLDEDFTRLINTWLDSKTTPR
jgi:hypothetical protein